MLRKFPVFILLLAAFAASILAHPLSNFSINQFSGLEVSKSQIKVRQILDMAEIPTLQAATAIDTDKNGELSQDELNAWAAVLSTTYLPNLRLTANGQALEITAASTKISTEKGSGDLSILRVIWELTANVTGATDTGQIRFENANYPERAGWNEVVVTATSGVSVFDSSAFGSGASCELKCYPQDSFSAPLSERSATFSYTASEVPANARRLTTREGKDAVPVQKDRLAEIVNSYEITPMIVLFGLLLAFGLGAVHAMSPGHGKTVVGAYLVGSRGTVKHAMFLGLTVTITHTLGVFALGLITLFASNYILPERLMPFLSFVSGLLVFYIGIMLFKDRLFVAMGWKTGIHGHAHDHDHSHEEGHDHTHDDGLTHTHGGTTHTHAPPEAVTFKSLLALGISGGLLPCPSALVLMLSAISAGRIGYGLILTIAFSFGLAATLTCVGLIFLYVGKAFGGTSMAKNRLFQVVPVLSALVIACVGAVICYQSLG